MSFFDDSTLAFLPSGGAGKDGKAYSIKPTNGTGDFTFSRGSNLTATRINASGLIEKGRENLFLNSDTPATQSITITNGSVYVFSFLGTGSVVATGGASFTLNGTGALDRVQNFFVASSTSVTLTISGTITEPQLELGTTATSYIETDASSALGGLLEDSPRFDYSGGASCPSLLIEHSRTNEIAYSEYFEGWTQQASPTITSNYGTSPEGLQNSSRLVFTNGSDYIETSVTNTSGVFSIYAKGTGNLILTDSGANASSTTALTSSYQRITLYFSTNTTTLQIKTDGSGLDAEVYGAQFENATYETSYIPNHSSGSATRNLERSIGGTISNINEGVLFFEGSVLKNNDTIKLIEFNDGGLLNVIQLYYRDSSGTQPRVYAIAKSGGTQVYGYAYNIPSGRGEDTHKVAFRFEDNNFALFYNGTKVHSQTSGTISTNPKNQLMYETSVGVIPFRGNVKQTLVFKTALIDDDCETLTTL